MSSSQHPNPTASQRRTYDTPRASFVSLGSEYSVATALAIDRNVPRTASPSAPPVPVRPARYAGDSLVGFEDGRVSLPASWNTNSELPETDDGFEIVDGADAAEQPTNPGFKRALAMLEGNYEMVPEPNVYTAMAEESRRSPVRSSEAAPAELRRLQHDLRRGLGPEKTFNVYDGDAVVVPVASSVPYASNTPKPRKPSVLRSASQSLKKVSEKVVRLAHRGSEVKKANIEGPVTGSLSYDLRQYPHGPTSFSTAVPLSEAQRRERVRRDQDESERYPNALPPRAEPKKTSTTAKSGSSAMRSGPETSARAQPAKVKTVGHPDRTTKWDDFINIPESGSEPELHIAPAWHSVDEQSVTLPKVQAHEGVRPLTPLLPPLPPVIKRKPVPSCQQTTKSKPDLRKSLPAPPQTSPAPHNTVYGVIPKYVDQSFDGLDEQIARMIDLTPEERQDAAMEAHRLKHLFTRPPGSSVGTWDEDERPTVVVDQVVHEKHTSWRVTDTSQPNVIESFYKRVEHVEKRDPDEAAELMERLELERKGMLQSRLGSVSSAARRDRASSGRRSNTSRQGSVREV